MECLPGETKGEETKRRGRESKLNGNTILCHPGDPITFPEKPHHYQLISCNFEGFYRSDSILYQEAFSQIRGGRITPDPHMPPPRLNLIVSSVWKSQSTICHLKSKCFKQAKQKKPPHLASVFVTRAE